jgi:hypothetical protein
MGGSRATYWYGNEKWCVECFFGEALGKEAFRRRKRRWGDIIEMDLKEMGWEALNCIFRLRIGTGTRK